MAYTSGSLTSLRELMAIQTSGKEMENGMRLMGTRT